MLYGRRAPNIQGIANAAHSNPIKHGVGSFTVPQWTCVIVELPGTGRGVKVAAVGTNSTPKTSQASLERQFWTRQGCKCLYK